MSPPLLELMSGAFLRHLVAEVKCLRRITDGHYPTAPSLVAPMTKYFELIDKLECVYSHRLPLKSECDEAMVCLLLKCPLAVAYVELPATCITNTMANSLETLFSHSNKVDLVVQTFVTTFENSSPISKNFFEDYVNGVQVIYAQQRSGYPATVCVPSGAPDPWMASPVIRPALLPTPLVYSPPIFTHSMQPSRPSATANSPPLTFIP